MQSIYLPHLHGLSNSGLNSTRKTLSGNSRLDQLRSGGGVQKSHKIASNKLSTLKLMVVCTAAAPAAYLGIDFGTSGARAIAIDGAWKADLAGCWKMSDVHLHPAQSDLL